MLVIPNEKFLPVQPTTETWGDNHPLQVQSSSSTANASGDLTAKAEARMNTAIDFNEIVCAGGWK